MSLAPFHLVLWLDADDEEAVMAHLVAQLGALTQFTSELDARLASAGVGGIEGAVTLYERLRGVLDGVSIEDLERMAGRVATLQHLLVEIDRELDAVRELKRLLERVEEPAGR